MNAQQQLFQHLEDERFFFQTGLLMPPFTPFHQVTHLSEYKSRWTNFQTTCCRTNDSCIVINDTLKPIDLIEKIVWNINIKFQTESNFSLRPSCKVFKGLRHQGVMITKPFFLNSPWYSHTHQLTWPELQKKLIHTWNWIPDARIELVPHQQEINTQPSHPIGHPTEQASESFYPFEHYMSLFPMIGSISPFSLGEYGVSSFLLPQLGLQSENTEENSSTNH